jgi:hypothetical protein
MSQKSSLGKTNQYSSVAKNVQKSVQEEPKITKEQVIEAFQSFGFTPNERNHNDIGYWTLKGKSELPKLMEELHKRRLDINKQEDDKKKSEDQGNQAIQNIKNRQNEAKATMPRLSDQDIISLYDEYGLPTPDPEWVRNHVPNDPKKIRGILEVQRKAADDMIKKHTKNAVNQIPEIPKASAMPTMPMGGAPSMGMGGPDPIGMQGDLSQATPPVNSFFVGDHALIRITSQTDPNSNTLWLADKKKKVLRPILSEKAIDSAFDDPEAAKRAIVTVSSKALAPGGPLAGFTLLEKDKGMKHDGSMDNIEFSPGQLQNRYGKPSDPNAENRSLSMLDGLFGKIGNQQQ